MDNAQITAKYNNYCFIVNSQNTIKIKKNVFSPQAQIWMVHKPLTTFLEEK